MKTVNYLSFDELVALEAKVIAKDAITERLAKTGIPLPQDIEPHIETLLRIKPEILTLARERVASRADAHTKALAAIGLDANADQSIEIEL